MRELLDQITALRHALHAIPEVSGAEVQTKAKLMDFLAQNADLELCPCGDGFYAAHREADTKFPSVALRADYDALALPEGGAAHLCGHDGHAAALCGVALALKGRKLGRNVFLLFQPAEETGAGAKECCALFRREQVDVIYGAHNLPGRPLGQVTTRAETFACASRGLVLKLQGKPTHAAYPELGVSPATAVGELLCRVPMWTAPEQYRGMTLCTVIGAQMGEKAFGAAAASAELWLTLRGEYDTDLNALQDTLLKEAQRLAKEHQLKLTWEEQDVFPSTENDPEEAERVLALCDGVELKHPMRWSEDYGHYLHQCKGAFFGIGAGESCPGLHTEGYTYPDELLEPTIRAFLKLL